MSRVVSTGRSTGFLRNGANEMIDVLLADAMPVLRGVVLLLALCFAYLVPTVVALGCRHRQAATVAVLNILLGWTLIGWVVALAIAVSHNPRRLADD